MLTSHAPSASGHAVYQIDPAHSSAQFSVRHMMISNVRGEFTKITGKVTFDPGNPAASQIDAVIDANSINTRESQRDAHLKSADFLDTARWPEIRFQSRRIERKGANEYSATGELAIRGVAKEVTLKVEGPTPEAKDPWGNLRVGATATGKIDRKDFGLVWNQVLEAGGLLVGDEATITIDVELIRQATAG